MRSPQKALYSSDILLGLWKATHMYRAVHVSRNDWRCPSLLPLAKPSLCTIGKEWLSSVESFLGFQDAATHTQCPQAKGERFTGSKNQRKSLCNQWLTTTLVEQRLQQHPPQERLILQNQSRKVIKETNSNTTTTWGEENQSLGVATLYS